MLAVRKRAEQDPALHADGTGHHSGTGRVLDRSGHPVKSNLVRPLIGSLQHDTVVRERDLDDYVGPPPGCITPRSTMPYAPRSRT